MLLTHLEIVHGLCKLDNFRCNEGGNCFSSFSGWSAFKQHFLKNHSRPSVQSSNNVKSKNVTANVKAASKPTSPSGSSNNFEGPRRLLSDSSCAEGDSGPDDDMPLNSILNVLEDIVLLQCAKMYGNHKFTRSHVIEITSDTGSTVEEMLNVI